MTYGPGGGADESGQTLTYTLTAIPAYVQIFKADGTTQVHGQRHGDGGGVAGPEVQDGGGCQRDGEPDLDGQHDNGTPVQTLTENLAITVTAVNDPPVLAAIGTKSVDELATLTFTLSATDVDLPANTLAYSATDLPAGASFDPDTREFRWTPTEGQGRAATT